MSYQINLPGDVKGMNETGEHAAPDSQGMVKNNLRLLTGHSISPYFQQVSLFCKHVAGFPADSGCLFTDSGAVANLNALVAARNAINARIAGFGVQVYSRRLVLYASTETDNSVFEAAQVAGIGFDAVRKVKVNSAFQLDISHLEELIRKDKAEGNIPFCVVANIGSANTGAMDPLEDVLGICQKYRLWFHIDGRKGAILNLLPEYRKDLACMKMADSVIFDFPHAPANPFNTTVLLHKYHADNRIMPEVGSRKRNGEELFLHTDTDLTYAYRIYSIWAEWIKNGEEQLKAFLRRNLEQAYSISTCIRQEPLLELMAPVTMETVCFRYNPGLLMKYELNDINKKLMDDLVLNGMNGIRLIKLKEEYCFQISFLNAGHTLQKMDGLTDLILSVVDGRTGDLQSSSLALPASVA